jgi:hypothetical protein
MNFRSVENKTDSYLDPDKNVYLLLRDVILETLTRRWEK